MNINMSTQGCACYSVMLFVLNLISSTHTPMNKTRVHPNCVVTDRANTDVPLLS